MHRFYFIALTALALCIIFPSCKSAPKSDVANSSDATKEAAKCGKWAKNPLFTDGQVLHFYYKLNFITEDMKSGDPGWKCEDDMCEYEASGDLDCTVKLAINEPNYCVSRLSCVAKDSTFPKVLPHGGWAVDQSGLHFIQNSKPLTRRTTPGCKGCEADTLEYDYDISSDTLIAFQRARHCEKGFPNYESMDEYIEAQLQKEQENGEDDDEDAADPCDVWGTEGCAYSGTTYICKEFDMSGYELTWDEEKGILRYAGTVVGDNEELGSILIQAK